MGGANMGGLLKAHVGRAAPVVGVSRFSRHLINVLLPAPLGPRRPIVPRGTSHTAHTNAPTTMLFVTPGEGTQNKAIA